MNRRDRRRSKKGAAAPARPARRRPLGGGVPSGGTAVDPQVRDALSAASRFHQAGDLDTAAEAYEAILARDPEQPHALYLLGAITAARGSLDAALELTERAVAAAPRLAEAHLNLGSTLKSMERYEEAEVAMRRAIELRPDLFAAPLSLARLLLATGRAEDAVEQARKAAELAPKHAAARTVLASALARLGRNREALEHAREGRRLAPDDVAARQTERALIGRVVPHWHFPMVNETARNDAYQRAIEAAVRPGMHVLEIGTGSGLLAMMAARAGAAHVTTCEMVPVLADTARAIIAANGYADRITVIGRRSTDLVVGEDLREPADLCISEVLSDDLVTEGALASLVHARRELLKPEAAMIPSRGAIVVALVGERDLTTWIGAGDVAGFDLRGLDALAPRRFALPHRAFDLELLSEAEVLEGFAFGAPVRIPPVQRLDLTATGSGPCVGVAQWIRIDLDDETVYENPPGESASHWNTMLYRFETPVTLEPGRTVTVEAHVGSFGLLIDRVEDGGETPGA